MNKKIPELYASIACNYDANILAAALPLLELSKVEAIEWSFDALFNFKEIPDWFYELLSTYSKKDRLIGHGVFFSLLSGIWSKEQHDWLLQLKKVSQTFKFDHVTEHFGFMTGKNFHHGAPLHIPYSPKTLAIGQDRIKRISEACHCPVGIENLAFSYSIEDVKQHGNFLNALIEPINGFIILDLHNLYCQIHNFEISFEDLINLYPLEKVREIHISGGSWQLNAIKPEKRIRRDTHDGKVPEEVFRILAKSINLCPNLKYVVLEQLGTGLLTRESKNLFFHDFIKMEKIIKSREIDVNSSRNEFLPLSEIILGELIEDDELHQQQMELSEIFETSADYKEAKALLEKSSLRNSEWNINSWRPEMIETAINIVQKWKK